MQKVYGLISDHGDGSSSTRWFQDEAIVNAILESDDVEQWYPNEGVPSEVLTFPDDLNLVECGFSFDDEGCETYKDYLEC